MVEFELDDPLNRKRRSFPGFFGDLFPQPMFEQKLAVREPLIDVFDRGKFFEIKAELPGIDKKDINIDILDNSISIGARAKHTARLEDKKKTYFYSERSFKSFFRSIPLPANVLSGKASASYKDGILNINLPKISPHGTKNKHVKIEVK